MSYTVNFERVGRNHDVEPLDVAGGDPNYIAKQIHDYVRPKLASGDVEVIVRLDTLDGFIGVGFHSGGNFTLEPVA